MNKKAKKILIIVLAVLLFIALFAVYILSRRVSPVPAGTVGNTAGNANNGGVFCEYNGLVYFCNPYDSNSIYSMQPDGTHIKKRIAVNASNLNAGGKYIFYNQNAASAASGLGYLRATHALCRAKLDGSGVTNITGDLIFNVQLIDNYLYYLTSTKEGPEFYKIKIDRSGKELLAKAGYNFACATNDGIAYYPGTETNHYLYRYDTKTGSSSTMWAGNVWNPIYDNGYFYYMDISNDYRLCRYSPTQDVVEVLTHDRVDCFNLANGFIYYQKNSATDPALMRMRTDGSDAEILMAGNFTHISVTSEYVYFQPFETEVPLYRVPVAGFPEVTVFEAAMEAAFKSGQK